METREQAYRRMLDELCLAFCRRVEDEFWVFWTPTALNWEATDARAL